MPDANLHHLSEALKRIQAGELRPDDLGIVRKALHDGLAGARSVVIGGNVTKSIIITGDNVQFTMPVEALEALDIKIGTLEKRLKITEEQIRRLTKSWGFNTEQKGAFRNRQNMLQLVWNTWIEGVLKKSLYNEMLIELGMETKPDAVEHPWDMVMQMPDREPRLVAPGTKMLELFDQANGSLLILGEPGSGKTTMLLELARQTIERARDDSTQPIPVVFNLSSWTPKLSMVDWLVDELRGKYYVPQKIGRLWVENDELLLLLDGLDEVKSENREACVQAFNAFRETHSMQLSVCSRIQEYEGLTAHSSCAMQCSSSRLPINKWTYIYKQL